jgi:putative transposase
MKIFLDEEDHLRFLGILAEVTEEFQVDCWSYCLMKNHYHLALNPRLPNISRAMQRLNGRYGQWWNWRHKRIGHTFQGRFKAQIADTAEYLLVLARYIARNPIRARLVASPESWRWSSYAATVGLQQPPSFLTVDTLLGCFGADLVASRARFAEYVLDARGDLAAEDRIRSTALILGTPAFERRVTQEAVFITPQKLQPVFSQGEPGPDLGLTPIIELADPDVRRGQMMAGPRILGQLGQDTPLAPVI